MANIHAERFRSDSRCRLVAACDIDPARATAFAEKHGIPMTFTSVDELLASDVCDAVSIVTPDAAHPPVALACLAAGRHVLCEKPLAPEAAQARKMLAAAKKAGVVNMVNFSYRDWPCIQGMSAAIARGEIGEIRHVEASYLQAWLASKVWGDWKTTPAWLWRLSSGHGSRGVLGDVGVHIVDFATYPCGPVREVFCRLKAFPKAPGNRIGSYRLDANDSAILSVEFANGALGVIHTTRWAGGHANRLALKISGTQGTLSIDSDISTTSYQACSGKDLDTGTWREVRCKPVANNYHKFISAILGKGPSDPDFARGTEIQEVLDACFLSSKKNEPVRVPARRKQ